MEQAKSKDILGKKKRGGRPKAPTPRKIKFSTYWTQEEFQELKNKSIKANLSISLFIRLMTAQQEIKTIPKINSQQYEQLSRLSANFNQFVKNANEGKIQTANIKEIIQMQNCLNNIRLMLIGAIKNG